MERYTRDVLVVEPDPVERERLAAALEGDGFQVVLCSGPREPDFTCLGARLGRCPLARDECVVVLETSLDSDAVVWGTSAEELLGFYLEGGHRVVTLGSRQTRGDHDRLLQVRRHPEKDELLVAVWWSAAPNHHAPTALIGAVN